MMYDIEVFRSFFGSVAKQLPGLTKLVDEGLSVLIVLHECLISLAGDSSTSTLEELIMVLHKRTGANVGVTRLMMKDLALLIACRPDHRRKLKATLKALRATCTCCPKTWIKFSANRGNHNLVISCQD